MGATTSSSTTIDIHQLYPNRLNLSGLSESFGEHEILRAIKDVPRDKSPGLDGFGSGFYQDFWHLIKTDIIKFFSRFFQGDM
jgi:mannosylglycoprotein endo-beta-mannosidase